MAGRDPVVQALDEWHNEGLVGDDLHATLRARAETEAAERRSRWASRFITGTGGALLVVAFIVLTTIFWDDLDEGTRAIFLWAVTIAVVALAWIRLTQDPVDRIGTALAGVALPLAVGSTALTRGWTGDPNAVVVSVCLVLSGALIGFTALRTIRHNPVLPAVGLAAGFIYGPVSGAIADVRDYDPIVYALDVAVVSLLVGIGAWVWARPDEDAVADGARSGLMWVSYAAAVPLIPITWFGPLDGTGDLVPVLAYALIAAGAVGFGLSRGRTGVLILGSLVFVGDAWYFGLAEGEAIGTFVALIVTALVVFWLGGRLGIGRKGQAGQRDDGAPPGPDP